MANHNTPDSDTPSWRFLGFAIERKADVASFVALMLSLIAAGMSLHNYLKGAEANIILPTTITAYSQSANVGNEDFQPPKSFIEFAFPFLAYNEGAPDTTSLIRSMELSVQYAGQSRQYEPVMFGRIASHDGEGNDCTPNSEEDLQASLETLCVFGESDFRPIVVKSDDVVQEEIIFIPRYVSDCAAASACHFQNFLWTDEVLVALAPAAAGTSPEGIVLELTFDLPSEGICLLGLMWCGRTIKIHCTLPRADMAKVFRSLMWVSASECEYS